MVPVPGVPLEERKEDDNKRGYDYVGGRVYIGDGWLARTLHNGKWFHITGNGPAYDERYDYVGDFVEIDGEYLAMAMRNIEVCYMYIGLDGKRVR